jgi:hypothetical protein
MLKMWCSLSRCRAQNPAWRCLTLRGYCKDWTVVKNCWITFLLLVEIVAKMRCPYKMFKLRCVSLNVRVGEFCGLLGFHSLMEQASHHVKGESTGGGGYDFLSAKE